MYVSGNYSWEKPRIMLARVGSGMGLQSDGERGGDRWSGYYVYTITAGRGCLFGSLRYKSISTCQEGGYGPHLGILL